MTETTVVLAEQQLDSSDVELITQLHGEDIIFRYVVLIPIPSPHEFVAEVVESISDLRHPGVKEPAPEQVDLAREYLDESIERLQATGREAEGSVVDADPISALRQTVVNHDAAEVIVVTQPHAFEDTFHQDWASRAREDLNVPVLHLYTGTSQIG